ncbi:MAG: aminoacyl-tRNA deacylase [Gaiellaceae bacterium]
MTGTSTLGETSDARQSPTSLLMAALDYYSMPFELIPHRPTHTARAEARAVGVDPEEVAKTIVLATPNGYIRVVLPASGRLDLAKARAFLGTDDVLLASEEMLAHDYPEFDLGAVPPIGGDRVDPVIIDRETAGREWAIFEAGVHDRSLRVKTAGLLEIANASIGDLCED